MIRSILLLSMYGREFMRRYMPTNVVLALIRSRGGLKWGVPAMIIAVPYVLVASWCSDLVAEGGPGWLHLIILVCLWNAMKFIAIGPISLVLLLRYRRREAVERRLSAQVPGAVERVEALTF